ncbi:MAG: bacterial Ig-like domain-containing protein, partial [Lachnospiraceae bacterium]|nr:bacterial Ig-like domain-containing protein [Lachnospiraceae bacterium]
MKKTVLRVGVLLLALIALTSLPIFASAETGEGEVTHYLTGSADASAMLGLNSSDYARLCAELDAAFRQGKTEVVFEGYPFPAEPWEGIAQRLLDGFVETVSSDYRNYYVSVSNIRVSRTGSRVTPTVSLIYHCTPSERSEIDAAAEKLLSGIAGSSFSDVEKALLVHDRLAVWCEYDSVSYANNNVPEDSYSIYGTMVKRISVCQGYAESYSYLMNTLGIPTRVVNSDYANHAWNIVTIGGKDYHVDVTWDDPTYDEVGRVTHDYFLVSTNRLRSLDPMRGAANDYDTSPVSTDFENGIWRNSDTAFTLLNGKIYYIDNRDDGSRDASRRKGVYEWNGGNPRQILAFADYPDNTWLTANNAYYLDSYARLSTDGTYLYFNLAKNVYRLTPSGQPLVNWTPAETAAKGTNIIGFREEDGWFIIRIGDTPSVPFNAPASTLIRYRYSDLPAAPTLTGISVVSGPSKTEFTVGETPDFSGLVIRKTYSDGTAENVTAGFTFSAVDTSSAGQKTVTVTLDGKQTAFTVTVMKAPVILTGISVVSGPAKTEFAVGEPPDFSGLVVRKTYSDGTAENVTAGFTF